MKKSKSKKNEKAYGSSDSEEYDDNLIEDPYQDDQIEKYHRNSDDLLMKNMERIKKKKNQYSSDEEEVLGFDNELTSDSDDEEMIDDDDEQENDKMDDNNYVNSSWGAKKSAYYSGNRIEKDEDAELEEEEALILQAKLMKQLDTTDFNIDSFKLNNNQLKTSEQIAGNKLLSQLKDDNYQEALKNVSINLEKLTTKEKLQLLEQESPELFVLIDEFKIKLRELENELLPITNFLKTNSLKNSKPLDFLINKTKLYLIYAAHMCFFISLKAQRINVDNHPVIKNILQFRTLFKQLEPIENALKKEIKFIKFCLDNNKKLSFYSVNNEPKKAIKKKSVKFNDNKLIKRDEKLYFDDGINKPLSEDGEEEEQEKSLNEEVENDQQIEKRAINYEMEKNKGLTPKRDKMYRNPRVRNRFKARKANIKYKSIVPKVRSQDSRYSGEATGIRTNIVRAKKIK